MRQVAEFDHLQALPLCVVLRTARGSVVERNESGWSLMGSERSWVFDESDFPARVLWTYHDEITADPDYIDPDKAVEFVRRIRQGAVQPPAAGLDSTGNTPQPERGADEAVG